MVAELTDKRRAIGISEYAWMFSISRDTAKRQAKDGYLRTIVVGGRRLVPMSEVERIEREGLSGGLHKQRKRGTKGM